MVRKRLLRALLGVFLAATWISPVSAHGDHGVVSSGTTAMLAITSALGITFGMRLVGGIKLKPMQYIIISLTLITGLIHLLIGMGPQTLLNIMLLLSGGAYIVLLICLYFPLSYLVRLRPKTYWVLVIHIALNIILFFVIHPWGMYMDQFEWLGLGTKVVELMLIGALVVDQFVLRAAGQQGSALRTSRRMSVE